jgi:hypothetical protein
MHMMLAMMIKGKASPAPEDWSDFRINDPSPFELGELPWFAGEGIVVSDVPEMLF